MAVVDRARPKRQSNVDRAVYRQAADELLERRRARTSLAAFMRYTMGPMYQANWHFDVANRYVQLWIERIIKDLYLAWPRRMGKTESCAIRAPAWAFGQDPSRRIMLTSYGADLAETAAVGCRVLMQSDRYRAVFPAVTTRRSSDPNIISTRAHFEVVMPDIERVGYLHSTGVGGPSAGFGYDLGIVDDPHKDRKEADSFTRREDVHKWFKDVFSLCADSESSGRLLSGSRWHEDDLAGRVVYGEEKGGWTMVVFPALAEPERPDRAPEDTRAAGEPLWPERFSLGWLLGKKALDPYEWASLFQQRPAEREGAIFKLKYWRFEPVPDRAALVGIIQSWDTAFKTGQKNDYCVCITFGIARGRVYILNVRRERMEFPGLVRGVKTEMVRWQANPVLVEDAASGQSVIQELALQTIAPILPIPVDRDKVARAHACIGLIEAGRVVLPERAEWLDDFLAELSTFPNGQHDDQVDALTQALIFIRGRALGQVAEFVTLDAQAAFGVNLGVGLD